MLPVDMQACAMSNMLGIPMEYIGHLAITCAHRTAAEHTPSFPMRKVCK